MNFLALIGTGLQILAMILKEYLTNKKANAEFELDQERLRKIVDTAVMQWSKKNGAVSAGASRAWDAADEDFRQSMGRVKNEIPLHSASSPDL